MRNWSTHSGSTLLVFVRLCSSNGFTRMIILPTCRREKTSDCFGQEGRARCGLLCRLIMEQRHGIYCRIGGVFCKVHRCPVANLVFTVLVCCCSACPFPVLGFAKGVCRTASWHEGLVRKGYCPSHHAASCFTHAQVELVGHVVSCLGSLGACSCGRGQFPLCIPALLDRVGN